MSSTTRTCSQSQRETASACLAVRESSRNEPVRVGFQSDGVGEQAVERLSNVRGGWSEGLGAVRNVAECLPKVVIWRHRQNPFELGYPGLASAIDRSTDERAMFRWSWDGTIGCMALVPWSVPGNLNRSGFAAKTARRPKAIAPFRDSSRCEPPRRRGLGDSPPCCQFPHRRLGSVWRNGMNSGPAQSLSCVSGALQSCQRPFSPAFALE